MSTKNQSYQILKLYNIMPLQSAVIASKRRINLAEFATPQHGLLLVDLHRIQRIFNPFHNLSSPTRGRILDMIRFLNSIQSSPQNELIDKTATILLQAFNIDLSKTISPSVNVLKDAAKIARNGYSISSLETATDYATKLLNCDNLPATMDVRAPRMIALNFMTISQLTAAFASKLEALYFAAPRLLKCMPQMCM